MIGLAAMDAVEMPAAPVAGLSAVAVPGGTMVVVCGWCNVVQGHKACGPAAAGKSTHGICPACVKVALGELKGAAVEVGPAQAGC